MQTEIGPTLREARNRRQVDLAEVEQTTKIRVRYLRALENEEWNVLPGPAYTRSFIRTYANYLGLDGERLADDFRRQHQELGTEGQPRPEPVGVPSRASGRGGGGPRLPTGIVAALISLGLIAVLLLIGVLSGGSDEPGADRQAGDREGQSKQAQAQRRRRQAQLRSGKVSLDLTASAEVWVCVVDASGSEVVDGVILGAGAQEGPFRSGRFDVAFGNGEVGMRVNGKEFDVPESSSPLGFEVTPEEVRPLEEGERPDCA